MFKIGLKLWSINKEYVLDAVKLFEQGVYDYIELSAIPGSYDDFIGIWKSLNIPFVIHAPHFYQGMCLSRSEAYTNNMKLAAEAFKFADDLNSPWVIFHSGVGGEITETARQLYSINDKRILIENKPRIGIGGEMCNGYSPQEISFLQREAGVGFCLDIGHAICAANALNEDKMNFLREMIALKPTLIHMTDGDNAGIADKHLHFVTGSYDFDALFDLLPSSMNISIECVHDYKDSLQDFSQDALFVKKHVIKKTRNSLVIKHASWGDAGLLFELANDPVVRKLSHIQKNKITLAEHLSWCEKKIDRPETLLLLVYIEDDFVGVVRFERNFLSEKKIATISISLHKRFRGLGLGSSILQVALDHAKEWGVEIIEASVMNVNVASKKIFIAAGFDFYEEREIKGQACRIYQYNFTQAVTREKSTGMKSILG